MKYRLLCLFAAFTASLRAEEYLTFSTVDLVFFSRYVVEVKPVRIWTERHSLTGSFQVLDILQGPPGELGDTIRVDLSMYDWREGDTSGCTAFLFLYGPWDEPSASTPRQFQPVSSGIRFFKNGVAYGLAQTETPGPFRFGRWNGGPSADTLRMRIQEYVPRLQFLRDLMQLEPVWERNDSIFSWIDRHRAWFTIDENINPLYSYGFIPSGEDQLGLMRIELFNRIINSGIPPDAWKAILRFHELMPAEDIFIPDGRPVFSNEDIPPPFASPQGVLFLAQILRNPGSSAFEIQQARRHLNDALQLEPPQWVPVEGPYAIRLLRQMLQLLHPGAPLHEAGIWALTGMTPDSATLSVALIDSIYSAAAILYQTEPTGTFQNQLAVCLATHLPASTWKQLSANDDNLCMLLSEVKYDTAKQHAEFRFRYAVGSHRLCVTPNLLLERADVRNPEQRTISLPRLSSYCNVCGGNFRFENYLQIPVGKLTPGRWRCRVDGTAGPNQEFHWQTNWLEWEVP